LFSDAIPKKHNTISVVYQEVRAYSAGGQRADSQDEDEGFGEEGFHGALE
jgi:hypothetical protein